MVKVSGVPLPLVTAVEASQIAGQRAREERQKQQLSIEEVAHRAGVSAGWLGAWERGQRTRVELAGLLAVAQALGIDSAMLLGGLIPDPERRTGRAAPS